MEALTVLLILFLGAVGIYMFFTGPTSFLTFILLFAVLAFILVHFKFITIDISKSKEIGIDFTGEPVPTVNVPAVEELHPVRDFFERMENFLTGKGWYLDSEIEAAQKAIKSANTMKTSTQEAVRAAKAAKEEAEKAEKAAKEASDEAGKITPEAAKIASLSPASANCSIPIDDRLKKIGKTSTLFPKECKDYGENDEFCGSISIALGLIETPGALSQTCKDSLTRELNKIDFTSKQTDTKNTTENEINTCTNDVNNYKLSEQERCEKQPSTGKPWFEDKPRELSFGIKYS